MSSLHFCIFKVKVIIRRLKNLLSAMDGWMNLNQISTVFVSWMISGDIDHIFKVTEFKSKNVEKWLVCTI